jgi:hypothetical protein
MTRPPAGSRRGRHHLEPLRHWWPPAVIGSTPTPRNT